MPDIAFINHGSMFEVRPRSDRGRRWLAENTQAEWPLIGGPYAVEWRNAADYVKSAREAGMKVVVGSAPIVGTPRPTSGRRRGPHRQGQVTGIAGRMSKREAARVTRAVQQYIADLERLLPLIVDQ